MHTTASDGCLGPAQLVEYAAKEGIDIIAVTDHDTTGGLQEAIERSRSSAVKVIPGIEISSEDKWHVLGYNIDIKKIDAFLGSINTADRNVRILENLKSMGLCIGCGIDPSEDRFRRKLADVLVRDGVVKSKAEAFACYIGANGKAYAKMGIRIDEIGREIREADGIVVLAHPTETCNDRGVIEAAARKVDGIEAYTRKCGKDDSEFCCRLAEKYGLLVTGGSDFHKPSDADGFDRGCVPEKTVRRILYGKI